MNKLTELKLIIDCNVSDRFASLLQSGIGIDSYTGESLGVFLNSLPGFDTDYLSNRVQTIFYDGNAVDDLEQCFSDRHHTIALSAAMPGLAGAIFRRNSLCAALRTEKSNHANQNTSAESAHITLKLFNAIALEKGIGLLTRGGVFSASCLQDFFEQRRSLLNHIATIYHQDTVCTSEDFLTIITRYPEFHLTVKETAV